MKKTVVVIFAAVLLTVMTITAYAAGSNIVRSFTKQIDETHSYYEAELEDGTIVKRATVILTVPDELIAE